jgi:hypothetical protein
MRASRRGPYWLAGLVILASLVLALTSQALAARAAQPGSSCAHPAVATLHRGQQVADYEHKVVIQAEYRHLIPGVKAIVTWDGLDDPGIEEADIICSARIQQRDGSWVGPTRLRPYPTPTPVGGEYVETTNPNTQFQQIVVKFAKSPVPRGANCHYPQQSRVGFKMQKGLNGAFRVGVPAPGMDEVTVTVRSPNIVICRAIAEEEGQADPGEGSLYEHIQSFPITIGPHGGISSPVPSPTEPTHVLAVKIYTAVSPQRG